MESLARLALALFVVGAAACNESALPTPDQSALVDASYDQGPDQAGRVPLRHRPQPTTCPSARMSYDCGLSGVGGAPERCKLDSDCTAGPGTDGRCVGNPHDGCNCSYDTCTTDADCATGTLCDCRDLWHYGANGPNWCLPSDCRVDADCLGGKGYCSPSLDWGCGAYSGVTGWYCHTPEDECTDDGDCASLDGGFGPPFCGYKPEVGHWLCLQSQCAG